MITLFYTDHVFDNKLITFRDAASNFSLLTVNCSTIKRGYRDWRRLRMILEDLYRGKYAPIESMTVHNDHDKLTQLQEAILTALPEDKKELVDATQDAFMEMVMDEGEAAFAQGVRFGIRLMSEIQAL